tara:strand:+ start:566 stop:805 length:240 start_codon:yes stop_codon:yes gene_type:complete
MYLFRGAIPVAAFAAPCHPWGLLNPIHGIQNSEKIHCSEGRLIRRTKPRSSQNKQLNIHNHHIPPTPKKTKPNLEKVEV